MSCRGLCAKYVVVYNWTGTMFVYFSPHCVPLIGTQMRGIPVFHSLFGYASLSLPTLILPQLDSNLQFAFILHSSNNQHRAFLKHARASDSVHLTTTPPPPLSTKWEVIISHQTPLPVNCCQTACKCVNSKLAGNQTIVSSTPFIVEVTQAGERYMLYK